MLLFLIARMISHITAFTDLTRLALCSVTAVLLIYLGRRL